MSHHSVAVKHRPSLTVKLTHFGAKFEYDVSDCLYRSSSHIRGCLLLSILILGALNNIFHMEHHCCNTYKEEHDRDRCNVDRHSSAPEWYVRLIDLSCDKYMYQQPCLQSSIPFRVFNFALARFRSVPVHLCRPNCLSWHVNSP